MAVKKDKKTNTGNNGGGKPKGYISAFDMEQRLRTVANAAIAAADAIEKHRTVIQARA